MKRKAVAGGSPRRNLYSKKALDVAKSIKRTSQTKRIDAFIDEDIDDDANVDSDDNYGENGNDDDNDDNAESADQKRTRLAVEYLKSIEDDDNSSGNESDNGDTEYSSSHHQDFMSDRLKRERLEFQGKHFKTLSSSYGEVSEDSFVSRKMSGHDNAVTCIALTSDEQTVYSGSKDNSVIKWDVESGKKTYLAQRWSRQHNSHNQSFAGEVLAVAVTSDGKYAISGGRDKMIRIFDSRTNSEVKCFQGHRDAVSSLCLQRGTYSLFSGSFDRCIKHWDLNEMGYIETMFGHQDQINSIDCWTKNIPVSSSTDRTIRLWKVNDESHLVFRGHKTSIDCVQVIDDNSFVSAGQDGSITMWKETQKKSLMSLEAAHGYENCGNPRWIASLSVVKVSDVAATGSNDGYVRLWDLNPDKRRITQVNKIPLQGFVNGLVITPNLIVAGTGREHRLGRWWHVKGNQNKVTIIRWAQLKRDV